VNTSLLNSRAWLSEFIQPLIEQEPYQVTGRWKLAGFCSQAEPTIIKSTTFVAQVLGFGQLCQGPCGLVPVMLLSVKHISNLSF
jgi:hypothetical protein